MFSSGPNNSYCCFGAGSEGPKSNSNRSGIGWGFHSTAGVCFNGYTTVAAGGLSSKSSKSDFWGFGGSAYGAGYEILGMGFSWYTYYGF